MYPAMQGDADSNEPRSSVRAKGSAQRNEASAEESERFSHFDLLGPEFLRRTQTSTFMGENTPTGAHGDSKKTPTVTQDPAATSEGSVADESKVSRRSSAGAAASGRGGGRKGSMHQRLFRALLKKMRFGTKYQLYSIFSCAMGTLACGLQNGWAFSAIMEEQGSNSSSGQFELAMVERVMIIGASNIAFFVACPPTGLLMDLVGRRTMLLVSFVPLAVGWLLATSATTAYMLFVARFITGLASGIIFTVCQVYVAEVSEVRWRGRMLVLQSLAFTLGAMLHVAVIPFTPLHAPLSVGLAVPLLFVLLFFLACETPAFFAMHRRRRRAFATLVLIRKPGPQVEEEFHCILECVDNFPRVGLGYQDVDATEAAKRGFGIMLIIIICQQFSGIAAFEAVTHEMYVHVGAHMRASVAAALFRAVEVVFIVVCMFLVDSWGRRPLLFVSFAGSAVTHIILSCVFVLFDKDIESGQTVPIILIHVFGAFYGLGMGPIPWTLIAEMFSTNVRSTVSMFVNMLCTLLIFVELKFFHEVSGAYGIGTALCASGLSCIVGAVFVWFAVPETKGRYISENVQLLAEESERAKHTEDI